MKTTSNNTANNFDNIYVMFHMQKKLWGLQCIGLGDFQDLVRRNCNDLFDCNRDKKTGRFCKPYYTDCTGYVVYEGDMKAKTGRLDFDGEYDTYYAIRLTDTNFAERQAMRKYGWLSDEVTDFLKMMEEDDGIDCEEDEEEEM